ncbi:MAG: winged helix-turn-helix domain-containing protein [Desulfurococcaceae archaeon]
MYYLAKQRDQIEIIIDILNGITRELSITRVMMSTGLNYLYIKRILTLLINQGFIISENDTNKAKHHYYVTINGFFLLNMLRKLKYLLVDKDNSITGDESRHDLKYISKRAKEISLDLIIKKRRSYLEIFFIILSNVIDEPRTLSSIANNSYLNLKQAKSYVNKLIDIGMIERISQGNKEKYRITRKGIALLSIYIEIYNMINRRLLE